MSDTDIRLAPSKRRKSNKTPSKEPDELTAGVVTVQLKNRMMEMIQNIMRKDVHMIFAEPVSDMIAPGYSSIIPQPMDLSTMQAKVQRGEYQCLRELKEDAHLMCKNCMVYNSDDTIFYKEAVKLQNYVNSLFGERGNKAALSSEVKEGIRKKNEIQEEWMAQEITRSVQKASSEARETYEKHGSNTRVGYLTHEEGGKVLLNILNPGPGEPTEKQVDMSCFKQYHDTTTSLLTNFRQKRIQPNKPPQYLHYGPFGSFAPAYDSMFSSLDEEEQQLLYSCYGDDLGLAYCRSVQEFAKGCQDSLKIPVDNILNSLTSGGHARANKMLAAKYAKIIREKKLLRAKRLGCKPTSSSSSSSCDIEEKTSEPSSEQTSEQTSEQSAEIRQELKEEDSLLKLLESDDLPDILNDPALQGRLEQVCEDKELQTKLDKTTDLLTELHEHQTTRLSQPPTEPLPTAWPVDTPEQALADKVKDNLTDMISGHVAGPERVVSQEAVRGVMGGELVEQAMQ